MDLIFESRGSVLLATATGEMSLQEAIENSRKMCDFAASLGLRKILCDCLALKGDLSPDDRFELGATIAEYCRLKMKIPALALVGKPPAVTGLGARIATNRGMPVEIFSDVELGLAWLKSRP